MTKLQKILSGILVLQITLSRMGILAERNLLDPQPASLLGDLKVENVVDLKITDDSGQAIHFAKNGTDWILPEAGIIPRIGETGPATS